MLFRFDPFDQMERITDRRSPSLLAMDAKREDDEIVVYLDAPGVTTDDIDITHEQDTLTVEVERRWIDPDAQVLARERSQGHFRRQIQFGNNVDLDRMAAKYEHGVITLSVPIAERAKARKVQIEAADAEPELTTSSS